MRSELDEEFIKLFAKLPERVQKAARKNYQLWKLNKIVKQSYNS